jgi:hypothetical protein
VFALLKHPGGYPGCSKVSTYHDRPRSKAIGIEVVCCGMSAKVELAQRVLQMLANQDFNWNPNRYILSG